MNKRKEFSQKEIQKALQNAQKHFKTLDLSLLKPSKKEIFGILQAYYLYQLTKSTYLSAFYHPVYSKRGTISAKIKQGSQLGLFTNSIKTFKPLENAERLTEVYALYKKIKSYRKVGDIVGLTGERVRQIISKGIQLGLYTPMLSNHKDINSISYQTLTDTFLDLGSEKAIQKLKITRSALNKKYPNFTKEIHFIRVEKKKFATLEKNKRNTESAYFALQEKLGYFPTAYILMHMHRPLYEKICRSWGSVSFFFKVHNIIPKYKHTISGKNNTVAPHTRPIKKLYQ